MSWSTKAAAAALLIGGILLGAFVTRALQPATPAFTPSIEPPAAAASQPDGSLVLERRAVAPTSPAAKPKAQLPANSTLERRVELQVTQAEPEKPVEVELNLVRMDDGTRRVVASAEGGTILGGLDVPIQELRIEPARRWAAGLYVNPVDTRVRGVFLDRDLGRMRVGAELGQDRAGALEARLKVGFTF